MLHRDALSRCASLMKPKTKKKMKKPSSKTLSPVSSWCQLNEDDTTQHFTDIFETPPEDPIVSSADDRRDNAKRSDEEKTVDLGPDTDLGSSEVELTQRSDGQNEVIHFESDKSRDSKRKLDSEQFLSEDRCNKQPKTLVDKLNLKSPDKNAVASDRSGETEVLETESEADEEAVKLNESIEGDRRNGGDGEGSGNSSRKTIENIDKYVNPSVQDETSRPKANRALPVSILGRSETAQKESDSKQNHRNKVTLLDVLRFLSMKCSYDHSLEETSLLDVAMSRGLTFP